MLVPQHILLPQLHQVLQAVMGWTDSHLHQFRVGDVRLAEPNGGDFDPLPIDYRTIALNQIARYPTSTCVYDDDFGDGWEHLIEVENELPIETVTGSLPQCLGGERACPPEDCGGPHGYAQLLAALVDPRHHEHDDYGTWVGGAFDPERFDADSVNRLLALREGRPSRAARRPRHR